MHSVTIFFGFLIGSYGLACCGLIAVGWWLSRDDDGSDYPAPCSRWVGPVVAVVMLPVPLLLATGGVAAFWWGFAG
jgi:hypothetical protein